MNRHLSSHAIAAYLVNDAAGADLDHIAECLPCRQELARFETSLANFREFVREQSEPASVRMYPLQSIWGLYPPRKRSWMLSLAFQSLAVVALFAAASSPMVRQRARDAFQVYLPIDLTTPKPTVHGGGGGGDRSPLPASQGKLPKPALRQFTPPEAVTHNSDPKLTMEPSIFAPPEIQLPEVASNNYGDPLGKLGLASNGPGSNGGIGTGNSGGVGPGKGPGVGPGSEGGIGGAIFETGRGVTAPVALHRVEPEYSDEARKAKYQGVVVVRVVIDTSGNVVNPVVVHSLGLGLDEKAIEAALKWRFRPAYKDGKPVAVWAQIEVSFRLL